MAHPTHPTQHPAPPASPTGARASRPARVFYALALALGAFALASRLVQGARTGTFAWVEMSLPAALMLGLTAVMIGPRRRLLYSTVLAAAVALMAVFYFTPRHGNAAGRVAAPAAGSRAR